jgi:hypothetical protein
VPQLVLVGASAFDILFEEGLEDFFKQGIPLTTNSEFFGGERLGSNRLKEETSLES